MKNEAKSLSQKLAAVRSADKASDLGNYVHVKTMKKSDTKVQKSWGPMMRV